MKKKLSVAMFGQKRLSREGGVEIVVKELCTRMAKAGHKVTCYNRSGHHVSGAEYDRKTEYTGIRQRSVPTIEKKGLAAVSSSFFAALCSAFGRYDVVHIHAEGPGIFLLDPENVWKKSYCDGSWNRLAERKMEIRIRIEIYPPGREKCCEICRRNYCIKRWCAGVF